MTTQAAKIERDPFGNPVVYTPNYRAIPKHSLRETNSLSPKMAFWLGLNVAAAMQGKPDLVFSEVNDIWNIMTGQD